ncbi:MAG: CRISPR-associated endonuclease Cas2 [Bacteroidetes bacterium]|nr:CRISPR-associated endonuclease Cas2 [Bacteroidota bacterium]
MYKLLVYDIEDDKQRTKLAKLFEKLGFVRLQKSVWLGHGNETYWGKCLERIKKACSKLDQQANVSIITIAPQALESIIQFGSVNLQSIINELTLTYLII